MKTPTTPPVSTPTATAPAAGGPPALPVTPAFVRALAKRVPFHPHAGCGKTVAYVQSGDNGAAHLFSATGKFVATETPAETAARTKAEADAKAATEAAAKAAAPVATPTDTAPQA